MVDGEREAWTLRALWRVLKAIYTVDKALDFCVGPLGQNGWDLVEEISN